MHPHVAPINEAAAGFYSQPPGTPQFNVRDNVWNNGEGFQMLDAPDEDYGGHLGTVYHGDPGTVEPGVELADIFDVEDTLGGQPGWKSYSWYDKNTATTHIVRRLVGYLRPGELHAYEGKIEDAAFELFAPLGDSPSNKLVVVLGCWATMGKPSIAQGGRFGYPGVREDGLVQDPLTSGPARPGAPDLTVFAPPGYTVISGYIVPRVFGRPAVFDVQRMRELRKAVQLILETPTNHVRHPPGIRQLDQGEGFPCLVWGGSFGGMISQLLCLRWPNEFHGAAAAVFGASLRRVIADQFNLEYMVQRPGFQFWGGAYGPEDTLEWGTALRWMDPDPEGDGWDYFNASVVLRHRRSQLHRPFSWLMPDEDTIGHATDFLPLITGSRSYIERFVSPGPPLLVFTGVDRRGHAAGWHATAIGNAQDVFHPRESALELLPHLYNSWLSAPTVPTPPTLADDGSEDSYAWVQNRVLQADYDPQGQNDPLVLDAGFGAGGHTAGHGLTLGLRESLRTAVVDGTEQMSIFVGDADGVVTRYVLNQGTLGLDVAARSKALGYGAFALAVGDLEDTHSGTEVVVGTKNHLFVLDAATLQLLSGQHTELSYEHSSPRRLQIADVFTGPDYQGKEIVFTSLLGHVVVFSSDGFHRFTDLGEPGVQDLAVLEGMTSGYATTDSTVPLLLLSHRGHLAHITCNRQFDPTSCSPHPAQLQAWTPGEHGGPADLEVVDAPGGSGKVAVAAYRHGGTDGTSDVPQILAFDALTLEPASMGTHGIPASLGWYDLHTDRARVVDIAPVHASGPGALRGFVMLLHDRIAWVPLTGQPQSFPGYRLDGFPPASRALAVTTADLRALPGGETYHEEIILSTLGGHVVWFHLEDMLANGQAEYLTLPGVPAPPSTVNIPFTNATIAGTWGMATHHDGQGARIFAANQSGELFELDPVTGGATRRADLRQPAEPLPGTFELGDITAPVRDLVHVGTLPIPPTQHAEVTFIERVGGSPGVAAWIETRPWQDPTNSILRPWWFRDRNDDDLFNENPRIPVESGFAPFLGGGDVLPSGVPATGATRQLHWWGGDAKCYTNLVQGLYLDASSAVDNWYSTREDPPRPPPTVPQPTYYGRASSNGKDLRNTARHWVQAYNHGSLRVGEDAFGPVVVASTPGGSVVLLRPGQGGGESSQDSGRTLWDSADHSPWPVDDGCAAIGLAVRPVPGGTDVDIFVGITVAHLGLPPPGSITSPGVLSGGIRWLRWHGTSWTDGTMSVVGTFLYLDPDDQADQRGGFGVCGLAVGDVVASSQGDELIATTMEGDLFVFGLTPGLGDLTAAPVLQRSWVRGTLGVNNGILIFDSDGDARNELFIAGSRGIWKWRQP